MSKKSTDGSDARTQRQISGKSASSRRRAEDDPARSSRIGAAQQAIGQFLRTTRESQRLTQEQVSRMTRNAPWQLSRAAISAIERGQNFPGMEAMLALSNVLFVDPKELIERARLSTVVPIDVTELSYDDLDQRANEYFWEGEFRNALAVYDAMLEKIALESPDGGEAVAEQLAHLEVRRATALRRAGALLSAIATAERAISLADSWPQIQARAYVALASLQIQRGNTPLARDAADRAIQLSEQSKDQRCQGWAWNVRAKIHFMNRDFDAARDAYERAYEFARLSGDLRHLTHNEGNIGSCWREQGNLTEARHWIERALEQARKQGQPALEASWLVELGRMAFDEERFNDADSNANAALRIAKPREHHLTIFRAEWLKHRVARRLDPLLSDRHRLHYLRKLYLHLDQYEGIDEIREFKQTALRSLAAEDRKRKP